MTNPNLILISTSVWVVVAVLGLQLRLPWLGLATWPRVGVTSVAFYTFFRTL